MYFTNQLIIKMKNEEVAMQALRVLVERLDMGFEYDKFKYNSSYQMMLALDIEENAIVLQNDYGCYTPEYANRVLEELMEFLAFTLKEEPFYCFCWNNDDYIDSEFEAHYNDGILTIKDVFYPNGYSEFFCCDECDEEIVRTEEFDQSKDYYCPKCGKKVDLLNLYEESKPIIKEKEVSTNFIF